MVSKSCVRILKILFFSLITLSVTLQILTSIFHLKARRITGNLVVSNTFVEPLHQLTNITSPPPRKKLSLLYEFFATEFEQKRINIGLVNTNRGTEEEWATLGDTIEVQFDRVSEELQWEDFFREWINEERWPLPKCPEVPMPNFEKYNEFDVVVSRMPCGNLIRGKGIRDVFRLQVNLVVANLVANGRRHGNDQPVYTVFIGSCEPMWEIFRCDDLLMQDGDVWIYKPDLRRLTQKVFMPVGTCQLALPYVKQDDGKIKYLFAKLGNTIDHPREAYVTVLHSSEDYVCGALALARSIIQTKSVKDLVLLADDSISKKSRLALTAAGWKIKHIDRIRSPHAEKDSYNEWNYSKLRIWQLTEYDKVIFVDSDLIIIKNIDNFFLSPQLSASSNNKVLFNSGIMLIEPSKCTFETLMRKRHTLVSYNGGDQGFLNEAFTWWHRWPKKSNFLKFFDVNDTKHELPESVFGIHFLGLKPWMCYRDYDCNWDSIENQAYASDAIHRMWWALYDSMPKKLQGFCALSRNMYFRIKEQRGLAKNARIPGGHWKIKIRDPRQHHLV